MVNSETLIEYRNWSIPHNQYMSNAEINDYYNDRVTGYYQSELQYYDEPSNVHQVLNVYSDTDFEKHNVMKKIKIQMIKELQ